MTHFTRTMIFGMIGALGTLTGCASTTVPERLPAYIGPIQETSVPESGIAGPLTVGLMVINDTSAPGSAPALSPEVLDRLARRLAFRLEKAFPLTVRTVMIQPDGISPVANPDQFARAARQAGVDYLMLAILSSSEVEVPDRLPLQGSFQGGGGRGTVLGFRAENYALAEIALLDARTGTPVIEAHGQAWAVLERLNVPIESNVYPVVRRDLTVAPIYPAEATAHDTLRAVAADDAIQQAMMHLKAKWHVQPAG